MSRVAVEEGYLNEYLPTIQEMRKMKQEFCHLGRDHTIVAPERHQPRTPPKTPVHTTNKP